ncbi:MAG: hypothetical protein ABSG53_08825 [Thermoguttaceae bacterium]|jgi:hypothetical protein
MRREVRDFVLTAAILTRIVLGVDAVTAVAQEGIKPRLNPKLAVIPESTWEKVAGFAPAPAGILAYSGGVYDSVHNQFLIFGGGHADYWGNEVCAFSPATLTWKRMYEPDAQARYTNGNIDNTQGKLKDSDKPYTRHTYNQLCFVTSAASMFIFGGAGPGWGEIRPTCPAPPDCWSYSLADNKWTLLYAGRGTPGGYAMACCYDAKRDVIWAYGSKSRLSRFDLKTKTWSTHMVRPAIDYLGLYNFHMQYLPKSDKILLVSNDTCTIDPSTFISQQHSLRNASGKAGLAYLPEQDVVFYVSLPGGETGPEYRTEVFDCAKGQWQKVQPKRLTARGAVWSRLQYDPVDNVLLLVVDSGVWAYKPPQRFSAIRTR